MSVGCVQSRSTTPSSRCRSPAHEHVVLGGPGPAHLAAVSADVLHAFAGTSTPSPGVDPLGGGVVGSTALHCRGGLLAATLQPASPCLGVSRDLLEATDYITGAVTSLVKELHSGRNDNDNGNWNDNDVT